MSALPVALALLCGVAITLQGQFMGLMERVVGTREAVFFTYAGGGLVAALWTLGARGGSLRLASEVPWYAFSAGLLGLVIVGALSYSVPRIGLTAALTIVVVAQFLVAVLLDHFGWFGARLQPVSGERAAGLALIVLGVYLVTR